jgi:hypothetical protein
MNKREASESILETKDHKLMNPGSKNLSWMDEEIISSSFPKNISMSIFFTEIS